MTEFDQEILKEAKNTLMITWEDEQTDELITGYINSSRVYFIKNISESLTFEKETESRELLIERVRYLYNNAVDDFEKNFGHRLAAVIQYEAVDRFRKGAKE